MKQTAVEWLCNEWSCIDRDFDLALIDKKTYWERLKSIQEQAKEMEKEQIMSAFETAEKDCGRDFLHGDLYYYETFKLE